MAPKNTELAHRPTTLVVTRVGNSRACWLFPIEDRVSKALVAQKFCVLRAESMSIAVPSAAGKKKQTSHSSCSAAHARSMAVMVRAVTVHVFAAAPAAVIKVSISFFTAHSPLVRRHEHRWLCALIVRHMSVGPDSDSARAHPERAGADVHQQAFCL